MRKYLELFKEGFPSDMSDRTAIENWPYVGCDDNDCVVFTVIPKPADPNTYVTFTAEEDNSSIGLKKLSTNQTLEYSTDTTTWNTFDTTTSIPLNNGEKVYVRGVLSADNTDYNYTQFKMSGKIAVSGNCNALWNYEDLNAPLKAYCGKNMFHRCTSLATAPELPAMELAERCYYGMFLMCTSLTTAPELPATTLVKSCYSNMLYGCTSLATAPELPAMELAERCYYGMFWECTSLTTAPELPATELAEYCYSNMFYGCASLTVAPELPAMELAEHCYEGMFNGCTSLATAPELPAMELAKSSYESMFSTCTSLTPAPELPAMELAERCYAGMFKKCTSLATAPELPATTLADGCYYYMFDRCTSLNHITCLATDISAKNCTSNWLNEVSSTGKFVKHPDMKNWTRGTSGIPSGWTVEDAEV